MNIIRNNLSEIACLQKGDFTERFDGYFMAVLDALKEFLLEDVAPSQSDDSPVDCDAAQCAVIIDVSGSMLEDDWKPTRLDAAKEAAATYARRLLREHPGSEVAVVSYSFDAEVACVVKTPQDCDDIGDEIDRAGVGGSTNMYAGLKTALGLFNSSDRSCQVVLLTDGHSTERNPRNVAKKLKEYAVIECVGIGGSPEDVDEPILREIASTYPNGKKRYRWIGQKEQLIKHFHHLAGAIRKI